MIEYTIEIDNFKVKSLGHYTTHLAEKQTGKSLEKYNVVSNRERRERVWGPTNYKTYPLIPFGITTVNYNGEIVEVELSRIKTGVDSEVIVVDTRANVPLRVQLRSDKKETLDSYVEAAQDYYNDNVLDILPEEKKLRCFVWDENFWDDLYKRTKRPLSTVHLHGKEKLIYEDIKKFMSDKTRERYLELGVPYKRNYLLNIVWELFSYIIQ